MDHRATGITPQRPPAPWEKQGLPELTKEPDQGAAKTSKPTSRSLAPLPGPVNTLFEQVGSFVGGLIASRPGFRSEEPAPAMPVSDGPYTGVDLDHHTGGDVKGETSGRGTF